MAFETGKGSGLRGDINVTPLVDVCLVLLIIFMVVVPYLMPGKPVQLPEARNPGAQPNGDEVLRVAVDAGGQVYFGEDPIAASEVGERVAGALAQAPTRPVQIQADRRCRFGEVKGVLRSIQESGKCREAALLVKQAGAPVRPAAGGTPK